MTLPPPKDNIDAAASGSEPPFALALPQRQKVVLVMDLVESVRLMAANELAVIGHWRGFVRYATDTVLPGRGGRLVKSLGDGIMAEFDSAREAAAAALALHHHFDLTNAALPSDQQLYLRAGLNAAHVYVDDLDIYGSGVNLAARVASLAGPGETMVTAAVRDGLIDGLDAHLEDVGECYLKHVAQPVRAWRIGAAGPRPMLVPEREYATPMQATVAVIPFEARSNEPEHFAVGELIADGVIAQLGRTASLQVISRLSATAFRGRGASVGAIERSLGANYVLSGSYLISGSQGGGKLLVTAELADSQTNQIAWMDRFQAEVGDLLQSESECTHRIAQEAHLAILNREAERVRHQPMATLAAYSLKLSGIGLMHRSQVADFERAQVVLGELAARHHAVADTHAWLAKWHVLRVIRGISREPGADAAKALDACRRALDVAPDHPLALAVKGYALCQMFGQGEAARECLDRAAELAPNEVHVWLYRSVWSSLYDSSRDAVDQALKAKRLSPLDPHAYFIETVLASAHAFNREYENAIGSARNALRLDRYHAPTLRALLLAQVEGGHMEGARETLATLLKVTPTLSVAAYRSMGSDESPGRKRVIAALRALDVPEHS